MSTTTLSYIEARALDMASYIILHHSTVRQTGLAFGLSKSAVWYSMARILPRLDPVTYEEVTTIFNENWNLKHLRGGRATAERYAKLRDERVGVENGSR